MARFKPCAAVPPATLTAVLSESPLPAPSEPSGVPKSSRVMISSWLSAGSERIANLPLLAVPVYSAYTV
jgi:hypothetical protein